MLKNIQIKNVALIEEASIEFEKGLNILSGETGSGKSVILDSLNFVLGAKADKSFPPKCLKNRMHAAFRISRIRMSPSR